MNITLIHEKCDLEKDNNTKLPYTSYVIQYEVDGKVVHDIAMAQKAVDIFDHYYDKYKKGFKWLKQSNGTQKPCLLYTSPSPRDRTRSRMPSSA